jgi:hypothetical protein
MGIWYVQGKAMYQAEKGGFTYRRATINTTIVTLHNVARSYTRGGESVVREKM